jgi:hypothetical protein
MTRPYKITVAVISETPLKDDEGNDTDEIDVQQNVLLEEFSNGDQEHVLKNFVVSDAVTLATTRAMRSLAEAAGYITSLDNLPGKPPGKPK